MADHHKGYGVPIGGVIAHETLVSPSGVGYDIGCGNKAVLTDADAADVRTNIARIMDDVWSIISFGLARKNKEQVDHEIFDDNNDDAWQITQGANSAAWKLTSLRDMARAQLGTVGSGNHYVDIFEDEQSRIWVGVHFGSRGFGHKIATRFLNRAGAAFPGQKGFVGGTMGETSVILEGIENEQASLSLYSTVHGAGRAMGRMEAKGKRDKTGKWKRQPKVTQEMMDAWAKDAQVELRGGGVGESPHCYKRLPEVLAEHADSIRVLHTLRPLGVAMAGRDVYDPFKD